jgi:hypothetical protein
VRNGMAYLLAIEFGEMQVVGGDVHDGFAGWHR